MEKAYVQENDELEIDLQALLAYLLRKAWMILVSGMVCAVAAMLLTVFCITPKYTSYANIYVMNRQTSDTITNSDLQSGTSLTTDYMQFIKSRSVIEEVIDELSLDATYENLIQKISVSTVSSTRVITISVTDVDPQMAYEITDHICKAAGNLIQQVMKVDSVTVIDEAFVPRTQSSPNTKKNVLIAAVFGMFLMIAVLSVRFVMNDKVVTAEDIERYIGISVLGVIPIDEIAVKEKKKRKKKK